MKTFLSVLIVLTAISGSATCFGAAFVALNNIDVNGGNGNPVFFMNSGTLADTGCYVEIFGGPDANSLSPIASTQAGAKSVFALRQGFFDGGAGELPGMAGNANAVFQAIAWKGTGGVNDWQTAQWVTMSSVWAQATGDDTPPPPPIAAMLQFPSGMTIFVPEPSVIALGILGAALLLTRRRRNVMDVTEI